MKLALSNIALTAYNHSEELEVVASLGIEGLEVAPSRVWESSWDGLTLGDVERYRREVEDAGLQVIGLHSLFYDQRDLGLFGDKKTRKRTLNFLEHLSKVCVDLGGTTLIYGGGRRRGSVPYNSAISITKDFFSELVDRTEVHNTILCFEPLPLVAT